MPTQRGFVEKLEIGRQGLVAASLLHDDGSRADYRIADLDSDPERFNERLSKLGILRDAMETAEPVEIEYEEKSGARTIERVARITRNNLDPSIPTRTMQAVVVGVSILATNRTGARQEVPDTATIATLSPSGGVESFILDLQIPERAVADAQLMLIRDAQASGETITLQIEEKQRRVLGVSSGGAGGMAGGSGEAETCDGFVEAIAHAPGLGGLANTARVDFTTAPPFSSAGNVVDLVAFTPDLLHFLVLIGSPEYEIFMAALRDKLRMRVIASRLGRRPRDEPPRDQQPTGEVPVVPSSAGASRSEPSFASSQSRAAAAGAASAQSDMLVRGAQLLHCLASASRPVWVQVSRKSLDVGPEAACTEGLPSSDLTPRTLRDLHIPYKAEWCGIGCFNHGVYRFQFDLSSPFEVRVDGEPLCVHAAAEGNAKFAHACLDGEHEVCVALCAWTCDQDFGMDVYRIR